MSVAIYVYKKGADLNGRGEVPLKTLIFPLDYGEEDDAAQRLGEDIVGFVDEFDGIDLDMVVEFRADPDAQRTVTSDGAFR